MLIRGWSGLIHCTTWTKTNFSYRYVNDADVRAVEHVSLRYCCCCVFDQANTDVVALVQQDDAASDGEEDALENLIQQELSKFQQQQAVKYVELAASGWVALPLPSPTPVQQLLRAEEHELETALSGEWLQHCLCHIKQQCSSLPQISMMLCTACAYDTKVVCICLALVHQ
jgi:hypothetical protein